MGLAADLGSVFTRWHTWTLMANQDIAMRYRRSVIGPFWISIAMAVMVFSIGLLFSEVQNQPFKEFLTYFGCSIVAWTFLTSMVNESTGLIQESEGQLRNVALPIPMLAAKMVYRNLVIFLHNALVIGIMLVLFGTPFTAYAGLALFALLVYVPLGWSIGIALGPICARFRDLAQVIASIMQVMFFMTPIFWMPGSNMDRHIVLDANPFYHLIEIFRRPLLGGELPLANWIVSFLVLGSMSLLALVSLAITRKRVFMWL